MRLTISLQEILAPNNVGVSLVASGSLLSEFALSGIRGLLLKICDSCGSMDGNRNNLEQKKEDLEASQVANNKIMATREDVNLQQQLARIYVFFFG